MRSAEFVNDFEEKRALQYTLGLLQSPLLKHKTPQMHNLISAVLGEREFDNYARNTLPKDKAEIVINCSKYGNNKETREVYSFLAGPIMELLKKRLKSVESCNDSEVFTRAKSLQKTFKLTDLERDLMVFIFFVDVVPPLNNYLTSSSDVADFTMYRGLSAYGTYILGCKSTDIQRVLNDSVLFKACLMEYSRNIKTVELSEWTQKFLSGTGATDLDFEFYTIEKTAELTIKDLSIDKNSLLVLDTILKDTTPANILFYGEPGTGKTSLARALARKYDMDLYNIKIPEDDRLNDRITAINAAFGISSNKSALILIDEADELLNTQGFFFKSDVSKSWINRMLESHNHKVIWITNKTYGIDNSSMRRFRFTKEFKRMGGKARAKILKKKLKEKDLDKLFTEHDINQIVHTYPVNADSIVMAIEICAKRKASDKTSTMSMIGTILKNRLAAIGELPRQRAGGLSKSYKLSGLNTTTPLPTLLSSAKSYIEMERTNISLPAMSMLFYGEPGTGKSEFVYHIGQKLGIEVLLKRSSDIQSSWVGETEQNIAKAFEQARADNSILFFDEADSFLFPRSQAERSWERSFTNEILTQLESFRGIVAFATNHMEGLDHAALRRFKFKVEFMPLTAEGNILFFKTLLNDLGIKTSITRTTKDQLKRFNNLTPGDFAVARDQCLFAGNEAITQEALLNSLANETRYKQNDKKIGFIS